jgi:hypothetical protein
VCTRVHGRAAVGVPDVTQFVTRVVVDAIGTPLPRLETSICGPRGGVVGFKEPYRHLSVSATGWHPTTAAMVWLADRTCRWACPCDCAHPGPTPAHAVRLEPPTDRDAAEGHDLAAEVTGPMMEVESEPVMLPGFDDLPAPAQMPARARLARQAYAQ